MRVRVRGLGVGRGGGEEASRRRGGVVGSGREREDKKIDTGIPFDANAASRRLLFVVWMMDNLMTQ